jgi:cytochrome c oxidase subunit III
MATTEAAIPETHDDHGHDHDHDHPSFLAHHFDTPEQQFDSGKLGMWLFLVTEILFFSGLFCAYAIFRSMRPDVFEGASQFLNTKLGAINTGVLLFSSLTMAWAVRAAQTEENKLCTGMLAATLSCAMIFLGVKTIEYSHKWGIGLLPPRWYFYDAANAHPTSDQLVAYGFSDAAAFFLTNSLYFLCAPFVLLFLAVAAWFVLASACNNKFQIACSKPLLVVCFMFFVGVGLGMVLESGEANHHDDAAHASAAHEDGKHADGTEHASDATATAIAATPAAEGESAAPGEDEREAILETLAKDEGNTGLRDDLAARDRQLSVAGTNVVGNADEVAEPIGEVSRDTNTKSQAGVFFAIYYCMTGIHAIHILAGIGVLTWLLIRSVRNDFNRQYFGPVDYVGLYWHIVDLIWIYLFPLLYLIR